MKRHQGPPTFESRVRGLLLGLALGDAAGSRRGDIPSTGPLPAGAATQLAAWTTEGLLRTATRYGGYVIGNPTGLILHAYQRWALLRGARGAEDVHWNPIFYDSFDEIEMRGWLIDIDTMAHKRGSSPTTLKAVTTGQPRNSSGCQAMLRGLPIAAFVASRGHHQVALGDLTRHGSEVAALTHDHPDLLAASATSVGLGARLIRGDRPAVEIVGEAIADHDERGAISLREAEQFGRSEPCVPQVLERLAPDRSGLSALAGAIYTLLSFPEPDAVADAIEFAGWAPDGDSVAAAAGSFLGALHGYEALPAPLVERLELGWVMDRLARDLALQITQNQAGSGWKYDGPGEPPLDPWWDTKYPGI